jgi:hypothetical protein
MRTLQEWYGINVNRPFTLAGWNCATMSLHWFLYQLGREHEPLPKLRRVDVARIMAGGDLEPVCRMYLERYGLQVETVSGLQAREGDLLIGADVSIFAGLGRRIVTTQAGLGIDTVQPIKEVWRLWQKQWQHSPLG